MLGWLYMFVRYLNIQAEPLKKKSDCMQKTVPQPGKCYELWM